MMVMHVVARAVVRAIATGTAKAARRRWRRWRPRSRRTAVAVVGPVVPAAVVAPVVPAAALPAATLADRVALRAAASED